MTATIDRLASARDMALFRKLTTATPAELDAYLAKWDPDQLRGLERDTLYMARRLQASPSPGHRQVGTILANVAHSCQCQRRGASQAFAKLPGANFHTGDNNTLDGFDLGSAFSSVGSVLGTVFGTALPGIGSVIGPIGSLIGSAFNDSGWNPGPIETAPRLAPPPPATSTRADAPTVIMAPQSGLSQNTLLILGGLALLMLASRR